MEIDEFLKLNKQGGEFVLTIPVHDMSMVNNTLHAYMKDGDQVAFTLEKFNKCGMKVRMSGNPRTGRGTDGKKISFKEEPNEESIEQLKKWARDANRVDKAFWENIRRDLRSCTDADFGEMCDYIKELHRKKNADYGDSFSKIYQKRGFNYAMGHIEEKMNRIDSVSANGNKVEGEKLEDSLVDLACYALMTVIELRRERE